MHFARLAATLAAGALLLVGPLSLSGAVAQNYNAAEAVSTSRYGTMSCGQFTSLSHSAQSDIVRRMARSAPMRSLASPPGPNFNPRTGRITSQPTNPSAVPGTPLTAGQLIAACQAVSPRSTLRNAFARSGSSPNMFRGQ